MQNILLFNPIYKKKIWGGRKLENFLGRNLPTGKIGESWEVSDYGKELSVISCGDWAGKTFREVYTQHKEIVLGKNLLQEDRFPLLVKIIDSEDKLSVQVHPDDEYSRTKDPENSGKKESWYILYAEANAEVVCGFRRDLDRKEYEELVQQNRAEEPLKSRRIQVGDAFIINPGTVHAIGAGSLILEVQQSSDSTYRVYDYGRLGDDGKPRELHLQKALDVLNFQKSKDEEVLSPKHIDGTNRKLLVSNDKFRMELLNFQGKELFPNLTKSEVFHIAYVIDGSMQIDGYLVSKGQTFLVTAKGVSEGLEMSSNGKCELALMTVGTDWVQF
jgi:mannose-6-phosphate isomerase